MGVAKFLVSSTTFSWKLYWRGNEEGTIIKINRNYTELVKCILLRKFCAIVVSATKKFIDLRKVKKKKRLTININKVAKKLNFKLICSQFHNLLFQNILL